MKDRLEDLLDRLRSEAEKQIKAGKKLLDRLRPEAEKRVKAVKTICDLLMVNLRSIVDGSKVKLISARLWVKKQTTEALYSSETTYESVADAVRREYPKARDVVRDHAKLTLLKATRILMDFTRVLNDVSMNVLITVMLLLSILLLCVIMLVSSIDRNESDRIRFVAHPSEMSREMKWAIEDIGLEDTSHYYRGKIFLKEAKFDHNSYLDLKDGDDEEEALSVESLYKACHYLKLAGESFLWSLRDDNVFHTHETIVEYYLPYARRRWVAWYCDRVTDIDDKNYEDIEIKAEAS